MRIAFVGGYPPNPEGEAHYLQCVVESLAPLIEGCISVFAHRLTTQHPEKNLSAHVSIHRITWPYHRIRRHGSFFHLKPWIERVRPTVVHFQAPHKALYGGVYGEPLLLLFHYLKTLAIPTVVTLHSLWFEEDFRLLAEEHQHPRWKTHALQTMYRWYHQELLRHATQVNALVSGDTNPLIHEFLEEWHLADNTLHAEPHPCYPTPLSEEYVQNAKLSVGLKGKRVILAFGFVRPDKGYHYLIEASAEILRHSPETVLVIAGQPKGSLGVSYAQQLQNLIRKLDINSQVIADFAYIPDEKLHTYLQAADIVAIPYTRVMGASGPMHHALSYGKPVIATNVGQNRGMQGTCLLVPPKDTTALHDALDGLLGNQSLWKDYHHKSLEYAHTHSWNHLAERYLQDYHRLGGGSR